MLPVVIVFGVGLKAFDEIDTASLDVNAFAVNCTCGDTNALVPTLPVSNVGAPCACTGIVPVQLLTSFPVRHNLTSS